jgi:hypothetical protein
MTDEDDAMRALRFRARMALATARLQAAKTARRASDPPPAPSASHWHAACEALKHHDRDSRPIQRRTKV